MTVRPRLIPAYLLVLAIFAFAPEPAASEEKKHQEPSEAAAKMLAAQGFAVEHDQPTSIPSVYRFPKGPVFVTADAGLGCYLALLRRIIFHMGGGFDAQAKPWLEAWAKGIQARTGPGTDDAAFLVLILRHLHGDPTPPGPLRAELEQEVARLKEGDDGMPFPRLATAIKRSPCRLWVGNYLGGAARWQVLTYLLTRVRISSADIRRDLQQTMPEGLRNAIERTVCWPGAAKIVFPGQRGLFDFAVVGDHQLPPGTLRTAPDLAAYVEGARLGNREAGRRLATSPLARHTAPASSLAVDGTLRAQVDGVLRTLAKKPEAVPALFKHKHWEALELQTISGANVLFDKAVGISTGWDVFSGSDLPGFVHPNPAFWTALAQLATDTAAKARELGIQDHEVPGLADIERMEKVFKERLASDTPFTGEEMHLLIRCGLGYWSVAAVQDFGKERYRKESDKEQASWKDFVREAMEGRNRFEDARKAAASRPAPFELRQLERLAAVLRSMASIAQQQLAGKEPDDLAERLWGFGSLTQKILSGFAEDPFCVCVPRLNDPGNGTLFQGSAHMDTLWVRYPWKDEHILCRGAVFSYREVVSATWITDAAWCERIREKQAPARPAWTQGFVAR